MTESALNPPESDRAKVTSPEPTSAAAWETIGLEPRPPLPGSAAVELEHDHGPNHFIFKYIFARDHKVIAMQFLFSSLIWMLFGGLLALGVRWQLAFPFQRLPIIGDYLFPSLGGAITPQFYNMMFTMHATIMIFLVIIPLLLGAFANFLIPLQIGAKDMAFPTLNMISYWIMWPAFFAFAFSFFVEGGAAAAGWTSYPPLANVLTGWGQSLWLIGITFAGTSSMMGSVNYMTTIINCRVPGMTLFRMPMTVWTLLVTSVLQAFAVPVLTAAGIMMLLDRHLGTSFFVPDNLYVNGQLLPGGGGSPLLWQHLFWFYSHPAVYIMILPAMGMVSEILATFSRKPLFGYRPMIFSTLAIAGLGFIVWGHHMFQSGLNPIAGSAFMLTTIFIALPSAIKVFNWLGTLWGGTLELTTPMLHALGFVSAFIIGGLSGIYMAATPVDIHIHDTYYIVAHLHYVLAGSSLFGIFAGITFWFPKMFGRLMNETVGKWHFALTFLFMNALFFPMHLLGLAGMNRRNANPMEIEHLAPLQWVNEWITYAAIGMATVQILFVFNFFHSIWWGKRAGRNPWRGNTLEWAAPSPPPHGNFAVEPIVYRGPHEFSSPKTGTDFLPQWVPPNDIPRFDQAIHTATQLPDAGG